MSEPAPIAASLEKLRAVHSRMPPAQPRLTDPDVADAAEVADQRWRAIVPRKFWTARLEVYEPEVASGLRTWGEQPTGRNLVVVGPVGTRKTGAVLCACRLAHDRGERVRFLPVVELLDGLRPDGPAGLLEDLYRVDRLILDDLGAERPSEWTAERLYALVNRRWLEERPTAATSNLGLADLERAVSERLYSRLVGDNAIVLRLTGPDRRRSTDG